MWQHRRKAAATPANDPARNQVVSVEIRDASELFPLAKKIHERLYFVRFEDTMEHPVQCMSHVYTGLGVSPFEIDPENLTI